MNIDYTIEKLKNQKSKIHLGDFEVWMNTTYAFMEGYFKSYQTRPRNFQSLINDFKIDKIGSGYGTKKIDLSSYKAKAIEYLDDSINYLEDVKKQEHETPKPEPMSRIKKFDDFKGNNSGAKIFPAPPLEPKVEKKPWGLKLIEFYSILSGALLVAFFLGKFEEKWTNSIDKETFRDEIKLLKTQKDSLKNEFDKVKNLNDDYKFQIDHLEKEKSELLEK